MRRKRISDLIKLKRFQARLDRWQRSRNLNIAITNSLAKKEAREKMRESHVKNF